MNMLQYECRHNNFLFDQLHTTWCCIQAVTHNQCNLHTDESHTVKNELVFGEFIFYTI